MADAAVAAVVAELRVFARCVRVNGGAGRGRGVFGVTPTDRARQGCIC